MTRACFRTTQESVSEIILSSNGVIFLSLNIDNRGNSFSIISPQFHSATSNTHTGCEIDHCRGRDTNFSTHISRKQTRMQFSHETETQLQAQQRPNDHELGGGGLYYASTENNMFMSLLCGFMKSILGNSKSCIIAFCYFHIMCIFIKNK